MNVKRYTARTTRDALALVRQALGEDAVILSTKPAAGGVEVLAMAPDGMRQAEAASRQSVSSPRPDERVEPALDTTPVEDDAERLSMSTLSFQDYVRDRMLKRRRVALESESRVATAIEAQAEEAPRRMAPEAPRRASAAARRLDVDVELPIDRVGVLEQRMGERAGASAARPGPVEAPMLHDLSRSGDILAPGLAEGGSARRDQEAMMSELRSMKGLIEERFGALAFMEKLQRQPAQARLTQKMLDCGFSPALIRKLADGLPADATDESAWAAGVLERNLLTGDADAALEDVGGVYALVGATGVGKTTSTAKIAAAFATRYGAANLGLITLDAYRVGAHEQLRAYGRILGVPVHTAHDRASLEDLLDLLTAKKMVLIDTAGMAQRDARTRELLDMLSHRSIQKLLVVNAASQGETIEDVVVAYRASACAGIVLSKLDEAVKLGPALDALIRHKLKVVGVANGQRVPEDWHRLSAHALVQRALRGGGSSAYRLDSSDVNLIFAAPQGTAPSRAAALG